MELKLRFREKALAGQADVSVRRAARIGHAWLIVNSSGPGKVVPRMQTYRATLKEYGRKPMEFTITVECYVGTRHATAHEVCRGLLEYKYNSYAAWGLEDRTSVSFSDFARDRFIIGDKVSVKEGDRALSRASRRRSLHHALPVAGAAAGTGDGLDPAARRDFRLVGSRPKRHGRARPGHARGTPDSALYLAGVPGFGSAPSLTSTSCAARKASSPAGIPQ